MQQQQMAGEPMGGGVSVVPNGLIMSESESADCLLASNPGAPAAANASLFGPNPGKSSPLPFARSPIGSRSCWKHEMESD